MASILQASFTGGEISPNLYNRVDLARWFNSLRICRNFITQPFGGSKNRPGFRFTVEAKDSNRKVRVIPFTPRVDQGYALEVGHQYIRVTKNGAPLYTPYASLNTFDVGTTYLKNNVVKSGSLPYRSLQNSNTGHTPISNPAWWEELAVYSPGGIASVLVDLITPYTESELADLRFAQSVDVMTITHPNHKNAALNHYSDANWTLVDVPNLSGPWLELNLDTTISLSTDKVVGAVTIKSTAAVFDAAKHVGRLLYIEQRGYGKPWEVGKAIAVGDIRRSDGKYYQAQNAATTGTLRPVHTQDTWYDGETGVNWLYLHSGYGIVNIEAVTDSKTATGTVMSRLPSQLSASGTGLGTLVDLAGATYAADSLGFTVIHKVGHGIPLTSLGTSRAIATGSGAALSVGITALAVDDITIDMDFTTFYGYYSAFDSIEPPAAAGNLYSDRWKFGAWGGDQGWPAHVFYYQNRRGYARTNGQPNIMWLTRTNAYNDFSVSTPLIDTDSITFPLNSGKLDVVQGVMALDKLVMLTEGAEWALGTGRDDVTTPGNSIPKPQGYRGSAAIQPLTLGDSGLFVQDKGSIIRDLDYDPAREKYIGSDLTVFADHLFEGKSVVSWTYQQHPSSIVWVVLSDGSLVGLTYMREQQVAGWHRHDSGGDFFESVACVGESEEDAVYVVIKRLISGTYKRYIERLDTRLVTNINKAFFVDSGLSYDGSVHTSLLSDGDDFSACTLLISGGTNWNESEQLNVYASEALFHGVSDVGDAIHYDGLGDGLFYRLTIEQFVDNHNVKVRVNQTLPASLRSVARLDWKLARNTFYIPHLIGREVSALADGASLGRFTVDPTGFVTIASPGVQVSIGIPITADMQTLSVTVQNQESLVGKKKAISSVIAQVLESRGLKAGRNFTNMKAFKERTPSTSFDTPAKLQDGVLNIPIDTAWGEDGSVCIRQDEPLPITITALLPEVVIGSL